MTQITQSNQRILKENISAEVDAFLKDKEFNSFANTISKISSAEAIYLSRMNDSDYQCNPESLSDDCWKSYELVKEVVARHSAFGAKHLLESEILLHEMGQKKRDFARLIVYEK